MSSRKKSIEKYHDYYYGNIRAMYQGFLDRFKDPEVVTPLAFQSFVAQNEVAAILKKRVSYVPLDGCKFMVFEPEKGTEKPELTAWLNKWLEGTNFGNGQTFAEFASEIVTSVELDGEAALKLILRNGQPKVRRIPDESLEILTDPDNVFEIRGFEATWNKTEESENGQRERIIKEIIDTAGYTFEIDGQAKAQKHGLPFIPVTLIKREDVQGSAHGRSGVEELIEPQDNLNRCLVNIARANKYGPWGLYCTEETGAPLPDGDVTVAPGALVATPIRKVSGDGAPDCLFREKEEILDAMYRIAGLSRNKAEDISAATRSSGKALVILNAEGKRYVNNFLARLRRGYSQLCRYAMVMAKKIESVDAVSVSVEFPSLDREDPGMVMNKARLLFDQEFPQEALRLLGYEDSRITQLLTDRDEAEIPMNTGRTEFDA